MKPHKSTILIMLLGLLLVAFVAVMGQQTSGQTPQQTGEQKKTEAALESCCKGDSCAMKKEGAEAGEAKEDCCGDSCKLHHENAKNNNNENAKPDPAKADPAKPDSAKHEGCCGESCDMSKHEGHDQKTHKADGSCCKAKQKDARKEAQVN